MLTCALNALGFVSLHYGYGLHAINLTAGEIMGFAKVSSPEQSNLSKVDDFDSPTLRAKLSLGAR